MTSLLCYSYLCFDAEGKLDQSEFQNQARLAMEVVDTCESKRQIGWIIFARHRLAEKRIRDKYQWTPDPALEAAIVKAALGKV